MNTNSNEAELKRQRRSIQGKLKRRSHALVLLNADIRDLRTRLYVINEQLREYQTSERNK